MSSSSRTPEEERSAKRKKFSRSSRACVYCRQKKLKCDAMDKFPNSCTQCQRFSLLCELGSETKRTASKILQPINTGSRSRNRSTTPPIAVVLESGQDHPTVSTDITTPLTEIPAEYLNPTTRMKLPRRQRYRFLYETSPLPDESVRGVTIPGDLIRTMFREFYISFYQHLPIFTREYLDPQILTGEKRIVFWAILAVSSTVVCPRYSAVLTETVYSELHSMKSRLSVVQASKPQVGIAFLLATLTICNWVPPSLPRLPIRDDQSWMLIGQAVYLGMQMGLHRSHHRSEYQTLDFDNSRERAAAISSMCWAGVFSINQVHCCFKGLPNSAPMSKGTYDHLTKLIPNVPELEGLIAQLRILHAIRDGVETLGNNPDTDIGLVDPEARGLVHNTIVTSFSHLVSSLDYRDAWTELLFLMGKSQFNSFLLAPDSLDSDQKAVAVPLYLNCLKINRIFKELMTDSKVHYRSMPSFFQKIPVISTIILYGLSISKLRVYVDVDECRNSVAEIYQFFKNLDDKFDVGRRATTFMDTLQTMHSNGEIKEPIFDVRTRMGASSFVSLMIRFKKDQIQKRLAQEASEQDATKKRDREGAHIVQHYTMEPNSTVSSRKFKDVTIGELNGNHQPLRALSDAAVAAAATTNVDVAPAPIQLPQPLPTPDAMAPMMEEFANAGWEHMLTDIWDWDFPITSFA